MTSFLSLLLGFAIGGIGRWLYFRIREWMIVRDLASDGRSFIQVCIDNLKS